MARREEAATTDRLSPHARLRAPRWTHDFEGEARSHSRMRTAPRPAVAEASARGEGGARRGVGVQAVMPAAACGAAEADGSLAPRPAPPFPP
ncbi:hypothetical protein AB1Y20_014321 [Prymnesium parvum]|uniref:Uncharacterized protein n=1 Tax=Prymnesium parvum TaxID=97485 RepID=A0AB34IHB2_PRYPA